MKVKVQKFEGRADYLRHVLSKSIPADVLDKPNLTHNDVANANSMLYEYWQLTRRADVENALRQPAGQAAAQRSKDANAFRRFALGEDWSTEDHRELVENMRRIKAEFPAVVSNKGNSDAIAGWLLDNKRYPTYANMRLAVSTLACEGKLLLNPSAVGIPEDRYGDSIEGTYQISRVSAADLGLMTMPYSAPAVNDESKLSADQYWAAHPELAAERHKHDRAVVAGEEFRKAESEVERFLITQLNYQPTSSNKALMLEYLASHKLPLTAEALFEAFQALKPQLAQSDKGLEFGSTRVIDLGERNQNPSYISAELRDDLRRRIARFSSQQYQDWLVRHPEEAAILDEG